MDPTQGKFQLMVQTKRYATFAEIDLEAKGTAGALSDVEINFGETDWVSLTDSTHWRRAIEFGVSYALESSGREGKGFPKCISILRVRGYLVDTTAISLAFAACQATWLALALPENGRPTFDREGAAFRFLR